MAQAVVKILEVDERAAVDALRSIDGAMKNIQRTAKKTGKLASKAIPVKPIKKADAAVVSAGGSLGVLGGTMGAVGVQSAGMSVALQAAATSAELLKGGTVSVGAALKGLVTSLGPVGIAILAIAAAVAIVVKVFSRHVQSVKEAKEALKKYQEAARAVADIVRNETIIELERTGELREAARQKNNNAVQARIRAAKKASQEEHKIEFQRAIEHTRNSWSLVEREKIKNDLLKKNRAKFEKLRAKIVENGRQEEKEIDKRFDAAAEAARQKIEDKVIEDARVKLEIQKQLADALMSKRELELKNLKEYHDELIELAEENNGDVLAQVELSNRKIKELKDKFRQEDLDAEEAFMADGLKALTEASAEVEKVNLEAAAKNKKIKDDAENAQAQIDKIHAERRLKAITDEGALLAAELEEARADNPEFKASFVGLQSLGKNMQEAAASTGESDKVLKVQEKIEENQRNQKMEQEKQAANALELQNKQLTALEKIASGIPAVAG